MTTIKAGSEKAAGLSCLVKIKFGESLRHCTITKSYHFILLQYILLIAGVLTTHAIEFILFLIIEHINIQVSHKARGKMCIRDSSFPWKIP